DFSAAVLGGRDADLVELAHLTEGQPDKTARTVVRNLPARNDALIRFFRLERGFHDGPFLPDSPLKFAEVPGRRLAIEYVKIRPDLLRIGADRLHLRPKFHKILDLPQNGLEALNAIARWRVAAKIKTDAQQ